MDFAGRMVFSESRDIFQRAVRQKFAKLFFTKQQQPGTGVARETMAQGTVWWNELRTTDEAGASRFYTDLLGWGMFQLGPATENGLSPSPSDTRYTVWMTGWTQTGGMMQVSADENSQWVPFISVADVDACTEKAAALGGTVLETPFDIPNSGRFAVLRDPQGAVFGIATPLGET